MIRLTQAEMRHSGTEPVSGFLMVILPIISSTQAMEFASLHLIVVGSFHTRRFSKSISRMGGGTEICLDDQS
jgi:hypothetical protein